MGYLIALAVFVGQEIVGIIVFPIVNRFLASKTWDGLAILKGMLERLVLFVALIHGYPQMLIAFGAMKLGTRLHEEADSKISNTYFLVGNFISMLMAMISSVVAKRLWAGF